MKIVHVVHWARSGIGTLLRDLVRHRSPDVEHRVLCLAPGQPVTDQIREAGAFVDEPAAALSWGAALRRLRAELASHRPDVVHSHSLTPRLLASIGAGDVPQLTTIHAAYLYLQEPGVRNAVKRRLEQAAARRLTGPCICVSADVERVLPSAAMSSRAVVIPNGIDLARARAGASAERPEGLHGDPLLVAVGRLDWEKGFDRLIAAVAKLRGRMPGLRLVICGNGREREALEAKARELNVTDAVTFAGFVSNPMPYLMAADAFVSSSLQEGFALTAAEAMAVGRPVIATPASGVGSLLRDGDTAFLAAGFGVDDIADAIGRAFEDRERMRRVADGGRAFADAKLDIRRAVSEYEGIYRGMASMVRG